MIPDIGLMLVSRGKVLEYFSEAGDERGWVHGGSSGCRK